MALTTDGTIWVRRLDALGLFCEDWQGFESVGFPVTRFAVAGTEDRLHLAVRAASGEIRVGELTIGDSVGWVPNAPTDGWAPAPATDLAWTSPSPGHWWLFGCGTDGSVRSVTRADGDLSPADWQPIGTPETRLAANPSAALAAVSRSKGQIEVFTRAAAGGVVWTWWS